MRHKQPQIIKISQDSAGFSVVSNSGSPTLQAMLHRAGAMWIDSLSLEFDSYLKEGQKYTFVMPEEFWAFNVGYYDVDIFSNGKLLKTVRVQYLCSDEAVQAEHVELEFKCRDREPANTDLVIDCEPVGCEVPDFCDPDHGIAPACDGDPASDSTAAPKVLINSASVATNEDLVRYIEDLTEQLDLMLDSGFYYNSSVPLTPELSLSVRALKETLSDIHSLTPEQAVEPIVVMQQELKVLTSQISRNMATAARLATRPPVPAIKPNPKKRIVKNAQQRLADQLQEIFKDA